MATRLVRERIISRAPFGTAELERRRANGLTAEQDALLLRWGLPLCDAGIQVSHDLTGLLEAEHQAEISDLLSHHLEDGRRACNDPKHRPCWRGRGRAFSPYSPSASGRLSRATNCATASAKGPSLLI